MTVKELMQKLKDLPPEKDVVVTTLTKDGVVYLSAENVMLDTKWGVVINHPLFD